MAIGDDIYTRELEGAILQDYAKGMLLSDACEKHGTARSTMWYWVDNDKDGLFAGQDKEGISKRFEVAKRLNIKAKIDEIERVTRHDSEYIFRDERGRTDTSLARIRSEAIERVLKLNNAWLRDNPAYQAINVDLSECLTAQDIQKIISKKSKRLSKVQLDSLITLHQAMIKAEEHSEIKEKLELALDKLNKLQESK